MKIINRNYRSCGGSGCGRSIGCCCWVFKELL